MFVGIAVGVLCNAVSGFVVTQFKCPPFISTLAMQTAARGVALLMTKGQNIYQVGDFTTFGQGAIFGVPTPIIFLVGVALFTSYLLNNVRLGRYIYAVGGNQEAARASGIQINSIKMWAFLVNGAFVGLAGVLFMSRLNAGQPAAGVGFEFGTAMGTLAGAFIMGFLGNIMNLLGIPSYTQQDIKGGIIVLAVAYDIYSKTSRKKQISGNLQEKQPARAEDARTHN